MKGIEFTGASALHGYTLLAYERVPRQRGTARRPEIRRVYLSTPEASHMPASVWCVDVTDRWVGPCRDGRPLGIRWFCLRAAWPDTANAIEVLR